jgi:hypothetical protein
MMWGADYPHIEGTWPHSQAALVDACNGCTAEEVKLMTSVTAADVYGFDLAALQAHADRVGPELGSIVTPAKPAPVVYSEVDYALGKVSGKESGRRLMSAMLGDGVA